MITKGIVEEFISKYKVKVRLPAIDGIKDGKYSTSDEHLSEATICSLPNSENTLKKGDIVFVGFEDNDLGKPIILGQLYRENFQDTKLDLNLNNINVSSTTFLPYNTSIGEVTPYEISTLNGVKGNIQAQLTETENSILYTPQTLTEAQKTQARANIGAGTGGGGSSDAVLYTPQTLGETQQQQARTNIGAASQRDLETNISEIGNKANKNADNLSDRDVSAFKTKLKVPDKITKEYSQPITIQGGESPIISIPTDLPAHRTIMYITFTGAPQNIMIARWEQYSDADLGDVVDVQLFNFTSNTVTFGPGLMFDLYYIEEYI